LIDSSFPERLMACNPSARLFKSRPAQPELMDAAFHIAFHYPGVFEHFQVLGNGGLGGTELASEFAGASGPTVRQLMNHGTASAIGQGAKCQIKIRTKMHSHVTIYCQDEIRNSNHRSFEGESRTRWQVLWRPIFQPSCNRMASIPKAVRSATVVDLNSWLHAVLK
jgi:hypothetical protein